MQKHKVSTQKFDEALTKAPSKSGGDGKNYPDIKLLIKTKTLRTIPIMIEAKGLKKQTCQI